MAITQLSNRVEYTGSDLKRELSKAGRILVTMAGTDSMWMEVVKCAAVPDLRQLVEEDINCGDEGVTGWRFHDEMHALYITSRLVVFVDTLEEDE